jgi:hypothetical protein
MVYRRDSNHVSSTFCRNSRKAKVWAVDMVLLARQEGTRSRPKDYWPSSYRRSRSD